MCPPAIESKSSIGLGCMFNYEMKSIKFVQSKDSCEDARFTCKFVFRFTYESNMDSLTATVRPEPNARKLRARKTERQRGKLDLMLIHDRCCHEESREPKSEEASLPLDWNITVPDV